MTVHEFPFTKPRPRSSLCLKNLYFSIACILCHLVAFIVVEAKKTVNRWSSMVSFFSQLFGILLDLVLPPLQEERLESFWGNQNMLVSDSYKALLSAYHVTLFEIDFKIKWKIGIQYTDML